MPQPLAGIRVADFSHVFAGPYASYFLALLGADVIKVESPDVGDRMRNYGPDVRYHGMAPNFIAANAGKRSLAVDLKQPSGLEVARRLIAASDIVIENLRPGVMAKLALDFEHARVLRPDIIYCAISGYGQTGPRRDYPAIDNIVQATSGMMDLLAGPDSGGELVPFPVVDTYTATQAALAILAALLQRNRDGGSQFIDVAMLDSSLTLMSSVIVPFLIGGILRTRHSGAKRGYSNSPLSGIFTTADGRLISLGVVQDNQFALFCELVDRPDLLADPRFANTVTRLTHGEALTAEVAGLFLTRSAEHWESLLSGRGVPCGVVRDIGSAASQPGLADRGVLNELVVRGLPDREQVSVIGLGFRFAHDGPHPAAPPPWLGEHSSEVLRTLGYDEPACAQLIASGVVRQHTACHQKR